MKTHAVVFPEPKRVEVREMDVPDVAPEQVGIRTTFSGISQGTERWALTGRYGHYDVDYSAYFPCSPGYQAAGVVEEVGSDVTDRPGGGPRLHDGHALRRSRPTSTRGRAKPRIRATWSRLRRRCGGSHPRSTSPVHRCSTWPASRGTGSG